MVVCLSKNYGNLTFLFMNSANYPLNPDVPVSNEAEACTLVLMACLHANELGYNPDNAMFHTSIGSRNIFKDYDPDALKEFAQRSYERAGTYAVAIDAALGQIREQTRLPLFYHCLDVILADGIVTPMEHKLVQYLKQKLKIDDELAWQGMEVLVAKNQL